MAQMAENFPIPEPSKNRPIVPSSYREPIPITGMPLNLDDEYTVKTPWLTEAARKVGEACGSAITYTVKTAGQVRDKWSDAAEQVQDRAERMKDEHPLAILGVIAGIAVSAGVLTRVWRSNRYE